uniref:Uncharacterized protein n=1 Tax=viral metagenome TaxID=1070528 RepID=A0A6C0C9Y9_9ZZZZ
MEAATHQCYSCLVGVTKEDLFAECMCVNDDKYKYRGICMGCKDVPRGEWKIQPDMSNHHLNKIMKMTTEYEVWWKIVKEHTNNGDWASVEGGDIFTFLYVSGPNGETQKELDEKGIDSKPFLRGFQIPDFKGKKFIE